MTTEFGWAIPIGMADKSKRADYVSHVERILHLLPEHFASAWMTDHFQWDDHDTNECWTSLAYFAGRHPALKFGPIVTGQSYRNPALLAKMVATLQFLSGGRFILGIGAGWKEDEYKAYGYPFPPAGARVEQLDEALQIIKALWSASPGRATFAGRQYQIEEAWLEPAPAPRPPIMVGAGGKRMLRVTARHADWWNADWLGYDAAKAKLEELQRACDEVGRDYASLRKTWFGPAAVAVTRAEAEALAAGGFDDSNGFVGTPGDFVKKIERFQTLGFDLFIFSLRGFPDPRPVELLISDVLPKIKGR
jgi:alkanesulfonate monooxygenase SsuD/methylene tetrahydromethanopterin reductase-like flavin-dependent oxidoreductase (luciferase family)